MAIIAGVILLFYPSLQNDWGSWIAYGFLLYALVIGLYGSLAFLRYRKEGIALAERGGLQAE
jgi:hypothetical protein